MNFKERIENGMFIIYMQWKDSVMTLKLKKPKLFKKRVWFCRNTFLGLETVSGTKCWVNHVKHSVFVCFLMDCLAILWCFLLTGKVNGEAGHDRWIC